MSMVNGETAIEEVYDEMEEGEELPAEVGPEVEAGAVSSKKREGIALCLSGGGFRAALFHLGALRRLNEVGIMSRVSTISSVSGGSIISAHLANRIRDWPAEGSIFPIWEDSVAAPFRDFTMMNLRTIPILKRLLPWNWFNTSTGVEALAASYERGLTRMKLRELPDRPRFIFCATDMAYGISWIFEKRRMGDFQAGYTPPLDWPVARAVAASSCFPPIFNPLPIGMKASQLKGGAVKAGSERDASIAGLRLTDGGAYDNMGLEPVWKSHACVLVSDGGATFNYEGDKNILWRLSRYTEIIGNQALALRKRWLIAGINKGQLKGAYWGIGGGPKKNRPPPLAGYSAELIKEVISRIRTDMDAFSRVEIQALENHGYCAADEAVNRRLPELIDQAATPFKIPHPEFMDERAVRELLEKSHERLLLGRW